MGGEKKMVNQYLGCLFFSNSIPRLIRIVPIMLDNCVKEKAYHLAYSVNKLMPSINRSVSILSAFELKVNMKNGINAITDERKNHNPTLLPSKITPFSKSIIWFNLNQKIQNVVKNVSKRTLLIKQKYGLTSIKHILRGVHHNTFKGGVCS